MLCDICKKNEAVLHIQEVSSEGKKVINLCNECAEKHSQNDPLLKLSGLNFFDVIEDIKKIGENATVTYEIIIANDVTDSYNDSQRQIEVLETEQQRLLELLKKAESLDDILEIESRLTKIRYELSSYEQQIEEYDDSVSYSALSLNISEVERETVAKTDSFFTKVSEGFMTSISDIGNGFADIAVGFLSIIPYLVLISVILLVAYFIVKAIIKRK